MVVNVTITYDSASGHIKSLTSPNGIPPNDVRGILDMVINAFSFISRESYVKTTICYPSVDNKIYEIKIKGE